MQQDPDDPLCIHLSTLIKTMADLDLHAPQDSFTSWKRSHKKPVSQQRPADMSLEQVDALLASLLRNQKAFEKWHLDKEREREMRREKGKARKFVEDKRRVEAKKKEEEMEKRKSEALKKWALEKRKREEMVEKEVARRRAMEEREERERQIKAKKAYEDWLKKENEKEEEVCLVIKRPMWVNVVTPSRDFEDEDENGNLRRTPRSASSQVLSPPNLYNDYKVYKKYAPEFFQKYKLLVASGGEPTSTSATATARSRKISSAAAKSNINVKSNAKSNSVKSK